MKFFDDKEEVLDIQLTQFGKHLLSLGKWKPVYYAFFDDNIIYDSAFAGIEESQNDIEPRIQENTPQMHTQYVFSGRETDFLRILKSKEDKNLSEVDKIKVQSTAEKDYSLTAPLGTSDYGEDKAPRWLLKVLEGKINETTDSLTGSFQTLPIPQIEIDLTYKIYPQNVSDFPQGRDSFGQIDAEELGIGVFQDGTFLDVQSQTILIDLEELNVPFEAENFNIEIFEIEEGENPGINQKFFQKKKSQIVNNILVSDRPEFESIERDSSYVEYYFDVFVDHEIDQSVMSKAITKLKSKGLYTDEFYESPEIPIVATTADLYRDESYTDLVTCNDENANIAPKASITTKSGPFIKRVQKPMDNGDENS